MPLKTAADFCDDNAGRVAGKEALVDARRRLTWGQMGELSDALALGLLDLGLEHDARVLIQMPNSAELFLARLACEKAGLRLVTVAPSLRRAELEPIIRFTRPEVAIVPATYRGFAHIELLEQVRVPELRHVLAAWDEVPAGCLSLEAILSGAVPEERRRLLSATRYGVEDVCQLATTSGSTGVPKCAAVPLYTRLLTAWMHLRRFEVGAEDTLCAVTAIISGVADGLVYNGVCQAGARVVLMDHFDPRSTCEAVAREGVNVLPMVPTMISRLLAFDGSGRPRPRRAAHDRQPRLAAAPRRRARRGGAAGLPDHAGLRQRGLRRPVRHLLGGSARRPHRLRGPAPGG